MEAIGTWFGAFTLIFAFLGWRAATRSLAVEHERRAEEIERRKEELRRKDEFDAVVQRATLVACLLTVHVTIRPSGDDVQTMIVITNGSPETFASLKLDVFADASAVEPTQSDEVAGCGRLPTGVSASRSTPKRGGWRTSTWAVARGS